jgi:hypothetical protein
MPHKPEPRQEETVKAGALLCPVCCIELIEAEEDFEVEGEVLRGIKVLRCPVCLEEQFSPEQQAAIEKRLGKKAGSADPTL